MLIDDKGKKLRLILTDFDLEGERKNSILKGSFREKGSSFRPLRCQPIVHLFRRFF